MSPEIRQLALPYSMDALEPYVSARTLHFHYEKHHAGYVKKLNEALKEKPRKEKTLEELILHAEGYVFNQAAQAWNHDFYWESMTPDAAPRPTGTVAELVDRDFGSLERFRQEFVSASTSQFGSGWAWLVLGKKDRLEVMTTHDADNPLKHGVRPLLTCDLWEHAYYLDYQNERKRYVETFLEHLIHWGFARRNVEGARATVPPGGAR